MSASPVCAALLLIGDELLSGKVKDENGPFLARLLRRKGIRVIEMCVVGDRIDEIGTALLRLAERASLIFTSGGVGPTHDDVTLAAVASATRRPLARHPEMERLLRRHFGDDLTEAALSMADLPAGTQMRAHQGWPVLRLDLDEFDCRLYILPGVPTLLRMKMEHLEELPGELPQGQAWHLASLDTDVEESRLAGALNRVVQAFPDVEIGSYPRWDRDPGGGLRYAVRITFEIAATRADEAEAARAQLDANLRASGLHRPA